MSFDMLKQAGTLNVMLVANCKIEHGYDLQWHDSANRSGKGQLLQGPTPHTQYGDLGLKRNLILSYVDKMSEMTVKLPKYLLPCFSYLWIAQNTRLFQHLAKLVAGWPHALRGNVLCYLSHFLTVVLQVGLLLRLEIGLVPFRESMTHFFVMLEETRWIA